MAIDSILKNTTQKEYFNNKGKFDYKYADIRNYYIESLIENQILKEAVYTSSAFSILNSENTISNIETLLEPFFNNVSNKSKIKKITHALNKLKKLQPGSIAPNFTALDKDGNKKMLSDYFGKPIYLFFWLNQEMYSVNHDLTQKFNKLKKEFPEIEFISIYFGVPEYWKDSMKENESNGIQLITDYYSIKEHYMLSKEASFILIDKKGKIITPSACWPGNSNLSEKLKKLK